VCASTAAAVNVTTEFCIAVNHPALPGHFPSAPVVPGALLLAEALQRLELLTPVPFQYRRIASAKFLRPVAPGATVTATLTLKAAGQASIDLCVAGTLVAHAALTSDASSGLQAHA
jgi:3-hydroxymyristoyl/3-hydroxydecanoyl-(acyl carrier protein) dehydratase